MVETASVCHQNPCDVHHGTLGGHHADGSTLSRAFHSKQVLFCSARRDHSKDNETKRLGKAIQFVRSGALRGDSSFNGFSEATCSIQTGPLISCQKTAPLHRAWLVLNAKISVSMQMR